MGGGWGAETHPINYELNGPQCSPQRRSAFLCLHGGPAVVVLVPVIKGQQGAETPRLVMLSVKRRALLASPVTKPTPPASFVKCGCPLMNHTQAHLWILFCQSRSSKTRLCLPLRLAPLHRWVLLHSRSHNHFFLWRSSGSADASPSGTLSQGGSELWSKPARKAFRNRRSFSGTIYSTLSTWLRHSFVLISPIGSLQNVKHDLQTNRLFRHSERAVI